MLQEMQPEELTGWRAYTILKIEEADARAGGVNKSQGHLPAGMRAEKPQGARTQADVQDWAETGPKELPPDVGVGGIPIPPAALWE